MNKPQKARRARNTDGWKSRPVTDANVVDFDDENSPGNSGANMTDFFVESTFKHLYIAYRNADKVNIACKMPEPTYCYHISIL